MIETQKRPINKEEKEALRGLIKQQRSGDQSAMAALFGFVISIAIIGKFWPWHKGLASTPPIAFALLIGAWAYRAAKSHESQVSTIPALETDLSEGTVEEVRYHAKAAVAVKEFEDEGSNYYIQLEDNRVVFLSGQYLYEVEESQQFPSTKFVLVRTSGSKLLLGMRCEGEPIAISNKLPAFKASDIKKGRIPEDQQIVDVDFNGLVKKSTA